MANPTAEIWGSPNDWHNTYIWDSTTMTGSEVLRCSRPKVPDFDGNATYTSSQLITGIAEGKIEKNKPIDKSITPCGQDIGASHLHFIGVYTNRNRTQYPDEDIQRVTTIVNMGMRTTPINWCFFERRVPNIYGNRAFGVWRIENDTETYRVWAPDSDNSVSPTNHTNGNYYVAPFVDYQLKSILLQIQVFRITGRSASSQIPTGSWISLEAWKNDYPTDSIAGARLQMLAPSSNGTNLSQITYYSVSPASERGFGAMILDEIPVGETSYSISPSFMSFGIQGDGNGYIYFFDIIQNLYGDKSDSKLTYGFLPCDGAFTGSETKTYRGTVAPYGAVWQEVPYDDNTYESLMSMAALYGCYFTPTSKTVFPIAFTDADLCLPIIDENGVAHGDYTRGTDNPRNDLYNADKVQDKNYNPSADVDPNAYSNITGFNSISGGASMTKRYVLDKTNVDKLADDLWTISSELAQVQGNLDYDHFEAKVIDNFLVTSPIDCIVSLKRYPFNVPHTFSIAKELVKLGKNTATAQGYATYNVFNTVQFAGINIYKRFGGCYLDYEPYTQYELYVPFCGTTNLQAADIVGHTLNVRLQIDLLTGTCTAYIMADSLVIETLTGNVGCDLQVTGTDTTYMNSAIVNSITNARNAKTQKEVADLSTISPSGLFSAVMNPWKTAGNMTIAETNKYQADYNLTHIQTPLHSMGTASALTGWYQEFNARLMIYYPTGDAVTSSVPPGLADLTNYGHTTGFATVENKTLSNFTGLTVCSDVDLSGISQATATEKQMIYNALTGGIYI